MFFNVLTNIWTLSHDFDVITNFLTPWRIFLHQDEVFDIKLCFWHHDVFCRHDELFDIKLCFWHFFTRLDVMTNFLASWRVFDVTTNIMTYFFDIMMIFWHNDFWRNDVNLRPDVKNTSWHTQSSSWRQKHTMTPRSSSWRNTSK